VHPPMAADRGSDTLVIQIGREERVVARASGPTMGWVFEIDERTSRARVRAEVLEVLDVPGHAVYRVRWEDGSQSTFMPSSGELAIPPDATGA
jgi:hypothetical protein